MTKKTATTKTTKPAAKPKVEVRKDAKGRFWLVPKDGGDEQGPFATKKEALEAKKAPVGAPAPTAEKTAPAKKTRAAKKAPKDKKLSAIDAAAQVLAGSKEPLTAKEMVEQMAAQSLWTSPGGKTPHATLYSAIIREIVLKGKESRFTKTERGKFAAK